MKKRFITRLVLIFCAVLCLAAAGCKQKPNPALINGDLAWRNAFAEENFQNVKFDFRDETVEGTLISAYEIIIADGKSYVKDEESESYSEIVEGEKVCYEKRRNTWRKTTIDKAAIMVDQVVRHVGDYSNYSYSEQQGGYISKEETDSLYVLMFDGGKVSGIRSNVFGTNRTVKITYGGQSLARPSDLEISLENKITDLKNARIIWKFLQAAVIIL